VSPQDCKPLPEKVNVLVNAFTYAKAVGADVFRYCCGVGPALQSHKRVESVMVSYTQGYPTDRVRNAACAQARRDGFHFLLMLDDDMHPDLLLGHEPDAQEFLPTALDFMLAHDGPCCVGAPYCGSPPAQEVVVMKNREYAPDLPEGSGLKLDKYTRDEAALLSGIKRVAALPTGCLLIDLRALDVLPAPWFSYEYDDPPYNTKLASTEDIVFTRNLDWLGVPQYCHWSAWAGHVKTFTTGKPMPAPVVDIPQSIYKAWSNGWRPKQPQPVS
jgi:hypothetical protein